jgi:hypothetical protein
MDIEKSTCPSGTTEVSEQVVANTPSPFEGVLAKVLLLCTHDPELSQLRETGRYPPIDDI